VPRYESLQPLYNLVEREPYESELEPVCREHGVGVINFYALASGFLTGKYRSSRRSRQERSRQRRRQVPERARPGDPRRLDTVAATVGATPAQVALAWQIARPGITAPIASATSPAQLAELVGAAALTLDTPSIDLIDRVSRATRRFVSAP
jgi:aryl-alcohol dehydrogenase-like predicted oxidoreductase